MHRQSLTSLRRVLVSAALLAMLGGILLSLAQCTMVGDKVTGVNIDGSGPTTCIKACNDYYKVQYQIEQKLHLQLMAACGNDAGCKAAEVARHSAAMSALSAAKSECQNNCHHQGVGTAG